VIEPANDMLQALDAVPWHRIERLQHIVGWFDHWLMGTPKPEYEVAPQEEASTKKGSMPAK